MWWPIQQLLSPCSYLRIRHGDSLMASKLVYDFVIPAVFTVLTIAISAWLKKPLNLYQHETLMQSLSDLFALLIAFYIAALAAVATLERAGIDQPLKGGDATLKVLNHNNGLRTPKPLTYRQYISYLFGYLSLLSLLLFMSLLFFRGTWGEIVHKLSADSRIENAIYCIIDPIIFSIFFFGVWQMLITSLLGIHFLADRMQSLNDPEN
jgi:hypothetical protein